MRHIGAAVSNTRVLCGPISWIAAGYTEHFITTSEWSLGSCGALRGGLPKQWKAERPARGWRFTCTLFHCVHVVKSRVELVFIFATSEWGQADVEKKNSFNEKKKTWKIISTSCVAHWTQRRWLDFSSRPLEHLQTLVSHWMNLLVLLPTKRKLHFPKGQNRNAPFDDEWAVSAVLALAANQRVNNLTSR